MQQPDEPYAFAPGHLAAFADVPAVRSGRVILCDGQMRILRGLSD